jgi:hypothetical protein
LLLKDGLDAVTISPTAIIGPYDFKPSYAGKTLIGVYRGNIPALVGGGFDWVDVRDVPQSALAASEDRRPPLVNGTSFPVHGEPSATSMSWWEQSRDVTYRIGRKSISYFLSESFLYGVTRSTT